MVFSSLGLSKALLRAVAEQGYAAPTPIQAQAIPAVLEGRDLLAAAQTGTGKTAAFTLPLLHRLTEKRATTRAPDHRGPRALVLVPTRELAAQVSESVRIYGRYAGVRAAVVFGGVGLQPQVAALRRGIDLLIATPGRLLDLVSQGHANLSTIEFLVLDEADRMLDMGFIHDIRRILGLLPKVRQNLLFSATFSEDIRKLAAGLLHRPLSIEVAPRNAPAELVTQSVYHVPKAGKQVLLSHLLSSGCWSQTLVFTRTKHGANKLAEQLGRDGFRVAVIHGNKSQSARTQALADFKADRVQVLVATDIAARGLDIQQLPHVVNYELPQVPEDYVHRIGRTGRAGADGAAVSLVCRDEAPQLKGIERLLGRSLPAQPVPEEILARVKTEPSPPRTPAKPARRSDARATRRRDPAGAPPRRAL
ncbi:DEAD/DEAH box helicase domain-containing protein [Methylocaldum marinum]|uniref:DEAD-box ATP-dependent RNA helicase RhpA n=1 Tax=Methylocaldum marinum TaxID=1432792 RepID=A0A250KM20_9GAMM|nr:DEAD/DEAH box helicase [Methylocaldum marinum]BBA32770.1 DEAD/DEAH box helicase domain-containing protein [Methylocaldum marinum]